MRGEEEGLKREFSLWAIFALAFAFISPIVALYGIFTFSVTTAGPAAWWGFFVVLAGQLLVAFVFAELASRWPYEGSLYQWARRLIHETYGWFTGWAYMWTLMITMVAVAYGAAGFVPIVLGIDPFTSGVQLVVAFGFVTFGTLMNMLSRTTLKIFMAASIGAEVLGSARDRVRAAHLPQRARRSERSSTPTAPARARADTSGPGSSAPSRSSAGRTSASTPPPRSPRSATTLSATSRRRSSCRWSPWRSW